MKNSAALKGLALAAMLAGTMSLSAQTFIHEGVVYKATGSQLTAQKATVKPENGEAPGVPSPAAPDDPTKNVYAGDIVIPNTIDYNGKTYTVVKVGTVFKGSLITSFDMSAVEGAPAIARGMLQNCTELVSAKLPENATKIDMDVFNGCSKLTEITIPAGVPELGASSFKGTTSLQKITFAEGPATLDLTIASFPDGGLDAIKEVVINRPLGDKYSDMSAKPFRGNKSLEKLVIGGACTSLPASYFENASALKTVEFNSNVTDFGTNLFAGTGIEEITLPASLTTLSASCFQGCKSLQKVVLPEAMTAINDMAFYKSTVAEVALPAGLKTIGTMAFSGAKLAGALNLPAALTSVGQQAFANNKGLTDITLGANLSKLGDGAFFGCTNIASYAVAAENEKFAAPTGKYLASKDEKTLLAYAPKAEGTSFSHNAVEIAPYAFYNAAALTEINLPEALVYGDYALYGTSIPAYTVSGTLGRYVLASCPELAEVTIDTDEIPYGVVADCPKLATVNLNGKVTVVKQDAFKNTTALKSLDLGSILVIIEADAFAGSALETIKVSATTPAGMAAGVFTPESTVKAYVPVELVDAYKNAGGWKNIEIIGDANLAASSSAMGMANGMYYAGTDGVLHCVYSDGNTDTYDVGGVPHTFQLLQFKNRIYGACAGQKFMYSATGSVDGDGRLFYISQIDHKTFQAVVFDNAGNNAYKDPFGLYIYGDTLFVNDRNVAIRKVAADAIALPTNYPSWVENNWLGYYGAEWSYGCIKAGFAITSTPKAAAASIAPKAGETEPLYWVGMKYNGNGIYRWTEGNIGEAGKAVKPSFPVYLNACNPIFTTFYVDDANKQLYIYLEKAGMTEDKFVKGGLYRIELSALEANPDPSDFMALNPQLIDGSPVKFEGGGANEHVGISQFSVDEDGKYMYWCYRAPSQAEADANEAQDFSTMYAGKYWWADKFEANNPLHQSGIKRIKLGEPEPEVETVVPGVEGYGVVPVKYEGSTKPADGANTVISNAGEKAFTVEGNLVVAQADLTLGVYSTNGAMVAHVALKAGQTYNLDNLEAGIYILAGAGQTTKIVK